VARRLGLDRASPKAGWFALGAAIPGGMVDGVSVSSTGLIRVEGWSADEPPHLDLLIDGQVVRVLQAYRLRRPDVTGDLHRGFAIEFIASVPFLSTLSVRLGGRELGVAHPGMRIEPPHYAHLFAHGEVLHRDDIYGVGPPTPQADPTLLELARWLPGSVLDFGCGSGALVRALREEGRAAHGLELERPAIRESLRDDVRAHVTLYDGAFPAPVGEFDSVLCSEVLEHITDWRGALAEIARICRRAAVFTVPDMSAVPAAFPHHVVPWHLLEATHVNFFTQTSLGAALAAVFPRVFFARLGDFEINGARLYTSLVAFCER
jgi:SAM-dependent methyltransferase